MPAIDQLDEHILEQLLEDGRKSFVEIGKVCNTPYEVIIKRYKEMKKKGIIVGATTQINYRFYGIRYMGTIAIDTEENAEELKKFLHTIPNVATVLSAYRKFGISVILYLTSVQELEEIKEKIRKHSPIAGLSLNSSLWIDIRNMPENLFIHSKPVGQDRPENQSSVQELIELDDTDIQLIDSLTKNARRPFSKIAKEIGTSVDTVIRRYDRLRKKKVLKVVIQIDPRKVGYQAQASFLVSIQSNGSMDDTINSLSKMQNVFQLTKIMGDADLFLLSIVRDFNEFFTLREEIAKLPGAKLLRSETGEIAPVFPGPALHMSTF